MRVDMTNDGVYRFSVATWTPGIYVSAMSRVLLVKSMGEISVGGAPYPLLPGDLMLLSPDDVCYVAEGNAFDAACWYYGDADLFGADDMTDLAPGIYRVPGQTADVRAILSRAALRTGTATAQEVLLSRMVLSELLLHLPDCVCTREDGGKIAFAASYLTAHYTENVSLDTLCERIGLSKFYLCRAFRRDTGMTPHAYLNLYRVLCADRLLRGGMGAMACGEQVGFRDYTTFFRSYKRMIGTAPSAQPAEACL